MNDPRIAVGKFKKIVLAWKENDPAENANYAACKALLAGLEEYRTSKDLVGNASTKLSDVQWHIDAMFGADIDNGHDFDQHAVWALGSIDAFAGAIDSSIEE
jgi:hypothetical protein